MFFIANGTLARSFPNSGRKQDAAGSLEQALVEAAELAGAIHQMDFQNPVACVAMAIGIAHPLAVQRPDAMLILVARDALRVREFAHNMARDAAAEFPARVLRGSLRETIELRAGDVW